MMKLNEYELMQWPKAAAAFYARGCNNSGHLLSACVAKSEVPLEQFDRAATAYRSWLVFDAEIDDLPRASELKV